MHEEMIAALKILQHFYMQRNLVKYMILLRKRAQPPQVEFTKRVLNHYKKNVPII